MYCRPATTLPPMATVDTADPSPSSFLLNLELASQSFKVTPLGDLHRYQDTSLLWSPNESYTQVYNLDFLHSAHVKAQRSSCACR